MAKLTQVIKEQKVNAVTGEVLEQHSISVVRMDREPDYVKLYLNDIMKLNDLPASSSSILFRILNRMGYDNKVVLVNEIKEDIAKEVGTSYDTVRKRITELVKKKILLPSGRKERSAVYIVNPSIFARGKWEDVKRIRLTVEYGPDGKRMSAIFDRQLEMFSDEEAEKE